MIKKFLFPLVAIPYGLFAQISAPNQLWNLGKVQSLELTTEAEIDYMIKEFPVQLNTFQVPSKAGYSIQDLITFDYKEATFKYQSFINNYDKKVHGVIVSGFSKAKNKPGYSIIVLNDIKAYESRVRFMWSASYGLASELSRIDFLSEHLYKSDASTTDEEMLYLSKGVLVQRQSGLDLEKKGYDFDLTYSTTVNNGFSDTNFLFRKLRRQSDNKVAAVSIECRKGEKIAFITIPFGGEKQIIESVENRSKIPGWATDYETAFYRFLGNEINLIYNIAH